MSRWSQISKIFYSGECFLWDFCPIVLPEIKCRESYRMDRLEHFNHSEIHFFREYYTASADWWRSFFDHAFYGLHEAGEL